VTAGVSYAIRLYYSMTRDYDYMVNTIYAGCDVSREVAKFLANQIVYNPEHGKYDINGGWAVFMFLALQTSAACFRRSSVIFCLYGIFCLSITEFTALVKEQPKVVVVVVVVSVQQQQQHSSSRLVVL